MSYRNNEPGGSSIGGMIVGLVGYLLIAATLPKVIFFFIASYIFVGTVFGTLGVVVLSAIFLYPALGIVNSCWGLYDNVFKMLWGWICWAFRWGALVPNRAGYPPQWAQRQADAYRATRE